MKKSLTFLAAFFLAAPLMAQEVLDQSRWYGGGEVVTADVDARQAGDGVDVNFTDSSGTSGGVQGTSGPGSTPDSPTCSDSGSASTPAPGGTEYRVRNGKVQRKTKSGTWVNMRKRPERKRNGGSSASSVDGTTRNPAEEVTSLPER
mgnify:CR=1 FL=1